MLSLHETTQRRACRAIFLGCAVLPTLATIACVAYALRPWRESDWQHVLARELHVRATVGQVTFARPGLTRLTDVKLADLRSRQPLGTVDRVDVRRHDSRLVLNVSKLQIDAKQLPALATTIATWLTADRVPAVDVHISRLELVGPSDQMLTLTETRLQSGTVSEVLARIGIESGEIRLLIERDDQISASLDTGANSLPTWLLNSLLPSLEHCTHATFTGSLRLQSASDELSGALRGSFGSVALRQWIDSPSQLVDGNANVEFDELQWHGDRVLSASGRLRANDGMVSRSLLNAAKERLYCQLISEHDLEQTVPFDVFACGFQLSERGLAIDGQCPGIDGSPDCLIVSNGQPLLVEPPYDILPTAQLVQVLAQPAASWLPASVEAYEMAGKLPLPDSEAVDQDKGTARAVNPSTR